MSLIGGYWRYNITKIEIIISDIEEYEVIKIYDNNTCIEEYRTKQANGIKSVYNHILKDYNMNNDKIMPEVWVHDIKTRVLKHRIE